jgi:hypothetical protein
MLVRLLMLTMLIFLMSPPPAGGARYVLDGLMALVMQWQDSLQDIHPFPCLLHIASEISHLSIYTYIKKS